MTAPIWRKDEAGLSVYREADDAVRIELEEGGQVLLTATEASALADAIRTVPRTGSAVEGAYYQLYYVHEYRDDEGTVISCEALGDGDGDLRYTWDESDLAAVQSRLQWLGSVLGDHHAERVRAGLPIDEENQRPWVSLFLMPYDERIWKGYWDEFDPEDVDIEDHQ